MLVGILVRWAGYMNAANAVGFQTGLSYLVVVSWKLGCGKGSVSESR